LFILIKEDKKMKEITFVNALNEALHEEMERDKNIILIGEDIGPYGGVFGVTRGLYDKYGFDRVKQTPISEAAIVGSAVGAAITGLRPIAEIMYLDFITLAIDQVVNQAAKLYFMSGGQKNVPLVIRAQYGTGTAEAAQHSQCLEAWFSHVPGLKVVMPSNAFDAKGLLKSSIRDNNPVIFLEHRLLYSKKFNVPDGDWIVEIGKGNISKIGKDITVVASGIMVERALQASKELMSEVDVEVIDLRTIYPLDMDLILESIKKTGKVLVIHEAVTRFGIGAEIVRNITEFSFDYLDCPPRVLGSIDIPVPYSFGLEQATIPQKNDIVRIIREMNGK
jgi:acetoin:2,6-dichlorophenolindophenol oxidoreductase subunit beta